MKRHLDMLPHTGTRHVLVAEDDENLNVLLSKVLHASGFRVTSVRNGSEALEQLGILAFDAILLDMMMPSVSGQGFVEHLTRTEPEMLRRVIVLSALPIETVRPRVAGVAAVLKKPFSAPELIAALDAVVFGSVQ